MGSMLKYLVTGAAGFIGFHVAKSLLGRGDVVVGLDNLNDYYDVELKKARLSQLEGRSGFEFVKAGVDDHEAVKSLFAEHRFDVVIHLAAQAGVRYSLENPHAYVESNLVGFCNVLEACRHTRVGHLVYASSSSVYGGNDKLPFSTLDSVDHPLSMYAATKKANELMAHTYSHLFELPTTGLRFFTVYGPWGRPDMAAFLFAKAMLEGRPIKVFNNGQMQRDFTYVDDIVEGVIRVADKRPTRTSDAGDVHPGRSKAPYRVYNIGNNNPVELSRFIEVIEGYLGVTAERELLPMQPGDVPSTAADVSDLHAEVGFQPTTTIERGLREFVDWYRDYYKV